MHAAGDVIGFWRDAGPARWFKKDEAFDASFRESFLDDHRAAARRELDGWAVSAEGALALVILLDQFPRNAFRRSAHAFATDPLARHFSRGMIAAGLDTQIDILLRPFCYMPFMHSEDPADQRLCVALTRELPEDTAKFARLHRDIIERFGRFPHRNPELGRETTPQEQAFLDAGGFSG